MSTSPPLPGNYAPASISNSTHLLPIYIYGLLQSRFAAIPLNLQEDTEYIGLLCKYLGNRANEGYEMKVTCVSGDENKQGVDDGAAVGRWRQRRG